tara:strand:+ start:141 stop:773 length:633 start_codon:yes stop_codon:yes gene_type:complete
MKLDLPKSIPVFPLSGVIFFPKTNLPLNIFEKRYLNLVEDCMKKNKYMGMVQSIKNSNNVYKIGCLGKITDYQVNGDGRILINLTGVSRFEILNEIENNKPYREFNVDYRKFNLDANSEKNLEMDIKKINLVYEKTKEFFKRNDLMINWDEFDKLDINHKINTLSMISPISNEEKQKLLETVSIDEKINTLSEIIEFYLYENKSNNVTIQ